MTARKGRCIGYRIALLFAGIIIVVMAMSLFDYVHKKRTWERQHSCGHSVSEAKAYGCIFDHISDMWSSTDCSYFGMDDFMRSNNGHNWQYWYDQSGLGTSV